MATYSIIQIENSDSQVDLQEALIAETGNKFVSGQKLMKFVRGMMGGARSAKVTTGINAARASGTLTLASAVATNTATVNGTTFTAIASGATGNQFNVGSDDTETAANFVTAFNASSSVNTMLVASSEDEVITITALYPGVLGNAVTLVGGTNITASGARLTGGDQGGVSKTHYYGSAS